MDPFGLFAALLGIAERLVTRRQRIKLKADTDERPLASFYPYDDAHTIVSRTGVVRIHNGGPGRVTVNGAGWEAKDGTRIEADVPSDSTLEPGDPELDATGDPEKLVSAHDEHRGLVRMYVELAGEDKPRRRDLPDDWITKVRELAEHDRRHG